MEFFLFFLSHACVANGEWQGWSSSYCAYVCMCIGVIAVEGQERNILGLLGSAAGVL